MSLAVSEFESAFLGETAIETIWKQKSFSFYRLSRPGAAFRQHELQGFAENFRVSAILAHRRHLRGAGEPPCERLDGFDFSPLFGWMADRVFAPTWLSPFLHLPLFFAASFVERRLLLPLIEPQQPPSKGAQKRLRADGLPR